jgi:FMN phosphatase YigB (HAD superfamily)
MTSDAYDAIIFDIGGVILDWNPRHLYRRLIPDPDEMERFLTEVCSDAWNAEQDGGRASRQAHLVITAPRKFAIWEYCPGSFPWDRLRRSGPHRR